METIEEREKIIELYERYGNLLAQSQKQALHLHLIEDLSYAEIANELAMTRPGAYDAVKKAKQKLILLDKKINIK
ncbi:sigma factor-like helix-turn-helix DNA-binding protein [Metamycoplasma canadense]|uniref:sigma factor-like helix-turn-helix DNA-binding protein n=1 Tax=Metamycoplasma canadense TaxID=29554 RepID=UPI0005F02FAA|nr:sigma factor-like helix-turn-helix DNA-binding protein [Metamycoplasma canadense]